jgi:hypothetical protein
MIIFFGMPKVASSFLYRCLPIRLNRKKRQKGYNKVSYIHHTNRDKRKLLFVDNIRPFKALDIKTFVFVRNPFTRLVSAFKFNFLTSYKDYGNFDEFCNNFLEKELESAALRPQTSWTHEDGKCMFDFIGRYEHLMDDLDNICLKWNIEYNICPKRLHRSIPGHIDVSSDAEMLSYYKSLYSNSKTIDRVIDFYRKDFELLNYSTKLEDVLN